jgi:hypothetical protein
MRLIRGLIGFVLVSLYAPLLFVVMITIAGYVGLDLSNRGAEGLLILGWDSLGPALGFAPLFLAIREFDLFGKFWCIGIALAFILFALTPAYQLKLVTGQHITLISYLSAFPWLSMIISIVLSAFWPPRTLRRDTSER